MSALPTGTVTFMFTDIEGSTRLVQDLGDRWPGILETHNDLARQALAAHEGVLVRTEGDAVFAAFEQAADGVAAAVDFQRALDGASWPDDGVIRVRIGLHTGAGVLGGGDYVGLDVHRAARIAATGHGGQIVVSDATATLVGQLLPEDASLRDLGKHLLKDLTEREAIFQIVIDNLSDQFPPLKTLDRVAHNLPVQMTSFVGRENELAEAMRLLEGTRILSLLGPGGTGKTRLALQIAAESSENYPDGTFFVPLAPITDPDLIPSTILSALGVPASTKSQSPQEHLVEVFSQRSALLVLDNFEQLVDGGEVVAALVKSSPGSRVLVTSRIPLRVAGEQEMPIAPLSVGEGGEEADLAALGAVPAVQLFVERVMAVNRGFVLTHDNAASVAELVRRLDGLPLAIELVVPQLRILPVEAVLERLDPSRLGGGSRDAPERHQTLWNAISWSVETLPEQSRDLLCRLAVFVEGGRLEEIEAVFGDEVIEDLATLVEHSLLVRDQSSAGVRFRWLRVIREYAHKMLEDSGQSESLAAAHAETYASLAEAAADQVLMVERPHWLEVLDRDHDNLRAALHWAIDNQETDIAFRLSSALWRFWQTRGHIHEARAALDRVMALEGGAASLRAKVIEASGGIAWWQGDLETADEAYARALQMQRELGDPAEIANALFNNALTRAYGSNDVEMAGGMLAEGEEIYRGLGDEGGLANIHWAMGSMGYRNEADRDECIRYLNMAVSEYGSVGNVFGEGWANFEIGAMLSREDEYDKAEPYLHRGLQLLGPSRDYSALVMFRHDRRRTRRPRAGHSTRRGGLRLARPQRTRSHQC
jgi:predicted ATPase/class 3 adenylate cyclase